MKEAGMRSRPLLAVLVGAALVAGAIGAWTSASQGATAPGGTGEPLTAARFELTIDGHSLASFSELALVSGFDRDELELVTRGDQTELKLPGKRTPPTVTLKRGMTRGIELAAWHELVLLGDVAAARKNVTLTMFNQVGDPVARWHLTDAWPSKYEIDSFEAGDSSVVLETVTLTCAFIQRVSV
jgi:phage tail-like protein